VGWQDLAASYARNAFAEGVYLLFERGLIVGIQIHHRQDQAAESIKVGSHQAYVPVWEANILI
jgi:hypothetical protein